MAIQDTFDVKFTTREVSAWGGLELLKRMLDGLGFKAAMQSWDLPQPGSNRGYAPEQMTHAALGGGASTPTLV